MAYWDMATLMEELSPSWNKLAAAPSVRARPETFSFFRDVGTSPSRSALQGYCSARSAAEILQFRQNQQNAVQHSLFIHNTEVTLERDRAGALGSYVEPIYGQPIRVGVYRRLCSLALGAGKAIRTVNRQSLQNQGFVDALP